MPQLLDFNGPRTMPMIMTVRHTSLYRARSIKGTATGSETHKTCHHGLPSVSFGRKDVRTVRGQWIRDNNKRRSHPWSVCSTSCIGIQDRIHVPWMRPPWRRINGVWKTNEILLSDMLYISRRTVWMGQTLHTGQLNVIIRYFCKPMQSYTKCYLHRPTLCKTPDSCFIAKQSVV